MTLRQLEGGASRCRGRLGLRNARLENGGIDLGHDLPRLHRRIKIDEQLLNITGDLAADLHVDDRVESTGGGDRLRDCAPRDGGRLIFGLTVSAAAAKRRKAQDTTSRRATANKDDSFHEKMPTNRRRQLLLDRLDRELVTRKACAVTWKSTRSCCATRSFAR